MVDMLIGVMEWWNGWSSILVRKKVRVRRDTVRCNSGKLLLALLRKEQ